jgi:glycosyltransferase involved in cell wall biosynthesis
VRVLHVIPSLDLGGAERLLTSLARVQKIEGQSNIEVFTLLSGGRQMADVKAAGVPVREFEMTGSYMAKVRALRRLRQAIRTSDADVIHAWMYHSALLAFLFARNRRRVVIAIHHTNPFDASLPRATRLIALGCWLASRFAGAIVYVAETVKSRHERVGFSNRISPIVQVGVDETKVMPATPSTRAQSRRLFGLSEDSIVVVHVARYHRDKDQATLLEAFGRALTKVPELQLLVVGRELDPTNKEMVRLVALHGLEDNVALIGELDSTLQAFHAADIFCLSSLTEAFPVSLVEALQCGLVPVVTDVGECRAIAEGVGFVVPPNSPQSLADALVKATISAASRSTTSIRTQGLKYGLSRMCDEYQGVYARMVSADS